MTNNAEQFGALDLLNILSFALGAQNLVENRAQSRHNDVESANNRQARRLLKELDKRFGAQNDTLEYQNELLEYQNELLEYHNEQMERQNRLLEQIIDKLNNAG